MSDPGSGRRIVPDAIRESYLLKLGIALGIVLSATGVVGVYAYVQTERKLDTEVRTELRMSAADEATTVENWLDERARLARMLSEYDQIRKSSPRSVSLFLQRERHHLPDDVFRIHLLNGTSRTVFATNAPLVVDRNLTGVPWRTLELGFSQQDDRVYRSQVYRSDGVPVVAFITPVPKRSDRFLVLTAELESVAADFDKPINGSFTQVVDGRGTVVIDERNRDALEQYVPPGERSSLVAAGRNDSAKFQTQSPKERSIGGDWVFASHPVEGTDWTVVVHAPTSEAFELRRAITLQLVALLAVAFVGVCGIGLTIGRNTVAALNTLSTKARALESGDLDVTLESTRDDEIGDLFDAFAGMRDSLRDRIEKLSAAKREAEDARAELAETNRDLSEKRVIVSVLNRLLTHNLRNSMTVVLGQARNLMDDLSGENAETAGEIHHTTEVTLRRIEKSKRVERVVRSDGDPVKRFDVTDAIDSVVEPFRRQYPSASIHLDLPEECLVLADDGFEFIVDNLVENAIEHNHNADPSVWITATRVTVDGREYVEIRVEDDGPGIPDMETEVLDQGRETNLSHGSGMGLWLVNWLVEQAGGDLSFEDRDPCGTVAVVRLQSPAE